MRRFLPFPTVLLAGFGAVVFLGPGIEGLLVYDRTAILSGQLWRLVTGHLVHFSASHIIWNVLVMVFAGWALKDSLQHGYGMMLCTAAAASGTALFLFQPSITLFGGLSGLATASVVYLCLSGIQKNNPTWWLWALLLTLTVFKIFFEAIFGLTFFAKPGSIDFVSVPLVHMVGGMTAGLFWIIFIRGYSSARMRT